MGETSTGVLVWWGAMSAVSVVNMIAWAVVATKVSRTHHPDTRSWRRWQLALSALFVLGCAFRSFLPRAEAQRIGLYDSWLSSAFIGRSVATVAELSLALQWALLLREWAIDARLSFLLVISWLVVPLIASAEVNSWYTALTTNFAGSVAEESTWAVTSTLMVLGMIALWARHPGMRRPFVGAAIVLNVAYVVFMSTVDVPMYLARWRADHARGKTYMTVADGAVDSQRRRIVTRRWDDWRQEMPWMSLYFSAGVWISISLVRAPRFRRQAPL